MLALTCTQAVAHEHKPPHDGTLVELGEEFAHLELVLDAKTGKLTGYVLDGEAEKAVRVKQKEIEIKATLIKHDSFGGGGGPVVELKLKAVSNALTGEKVGDTSQFEVQEAQLKGISKFKGAVASLEVKGKEFKAVGFLFPEGNESEKGKDQKRVEPKKP